METAIIPAARIESTTLNFRLPDWPAQRLIREASLAWSLRHLDEPPLDPDESPWPLIRGATLGLFKAFPQSVRRRAPGAMRA